MHTESLTEMEITPPMLKHSINENGLSMPDHNCRKTSFKEIHESFNETGPLPNRLRTSSKNENKKYFIYKLVRYKRTPEKTLLHVRRYRYDPVDDTFDQEANIPAHNIAKYWRFIAGSKYGNSKLRGRVTSNHRWEGFSLYSSTNGLITIKRAWT